VQRADFVNAFAEVLHSIGWPEVPVRGERVGRMPPAMEIANDQRPWTHVHDLANEVVERICRIDDILIVAAGHVTRLEAHAGGRVRVLFDVEQILIVLAEREALLVTVDDVTGELGRAGEPIERIALVSRGTDEAR